MWNALSTSSSEKCPACEKGSSSNAFPTFRNRPTDSAKKGLKFKSPRNSERLCPAPRNRKLGALLAHIRCQKQASFFMDLFRVLFIIYIYMLHVFSTSFLVIEYVGIITLFSICLQAAPTQGIFAVGLQRGTHAHVHVLIRTRLPRCKETAKSRLRSVPLSKQVLSGACCSL